MKNFTNIQQKRIESEIKSNEAISGFLLGGGFIFFIFLVSMKTPLFIVVVVAFFIMAIEVSCQRTRNRLTRELAAVMHVKTMQ